jgi:hypothetical protein
LSLVLTQSFAQKNYDKHWIITNYYNDKPVIISFGKDSISTRLANNTTIDFSTSNATISDANGNLKYYAGNCGILGANYKVLPNGLKINPGPADDDYCPSYPLVNAILLLPCPEDSSRYFAIHDRASKKYAYIEADKHNVLVVGNTLYSEINTKLNNGIGDVTQKAQVVVTDTLSDYGLSTCMHANGKDYWIISSQANTLGFHRSLLTKDGVHYIGEQVFKHNYLKSIYSAGQTNFSSDGTKFVMGDNRNKKIFLFDFDRCSGLLSNLRTFEIPKPVGTCTGLEFSPNGKLLYHTNSQYLRQYNLSDPDPMTSVIIIDSSKYIKAPLPTTFYRCELAPNGKIYIGGTNTSSVLHVIHNPDVRGKECNFEQLSVKLPAWYDIGLPNMPNFRIGASDPNCMVSVKTREISKSNIDYFSLYPNPTNGEINILNNYEHIFQKMGWQLYDSVGRLIFEKELDNNLEVFHLPTKLTSGIYIWRIEDKNKVWQHGKLILVD